MTKILRGVYGFHVAKERGDLIERAKAEEATMTNNEIIASFTDWYDILPTGSLCPSFDDRMSFWHGPGGLLEMIEKKGPFDEFLRKFLAAVAVETRDARGYIAKEEDGSEWVELGTVWEMMTASPVQLAAALVKTIEETP